MEAEIGGKQPKSRKAESYQQLKEAGDASSPRARGENAVPPEAGTLIADVWPPEL